MGIFLKVFNLVPPQYKWAFWLVVGLAIFAAGGYAGSRVQSVLDTTEINSLKTQLTDKTNELSICNTDKKTLSGAIDVQNAATQSAKDEAEAQKKWAAEQVAESNKRASKFIADAATLLKTKPPVGVDLCVAAREAFDLELRMERNLP